jgi:hypothetical protein
MEENLNLKIRIKVLEQALENLLNCTELNMDDMEDNTIETVEKALSVLNEN